MSRNAETLAPAPIGKPPERRLRNLIQAALPGAQIVRVVPLKLDSAAEDESAKGAGYGAPVRVDLRVGHAERSVVLRSATANQFGHDRRADRAQATILAADTFGELPRHVSVLDYGAYRSADQFVSLAGSREFYLLTTYAEGRMYADDLRELARTGSLLARDISRSHALVDYLTRVHAHRPPNPGTGYARFLRDTLGSGEGIFGIVDGYPEDVPEAPRARLERIEERCLAWRARLRNRPERLRRTHGDFHPFNVLFDEHSALSVLDTSRGSLGDPADDVACMAINYAFFSLGHAGAWRGAQRALWYGFWQRYCDRTGDAALYDVAAPLLAWRGLVLASPVWYPDLAPSDRGRILGFVERVLEADRLSLGMADEFFDT
jgi:hypothetical protein